MRNIWLYIVLSSIFAIVVACGYTIYKCVQYPVEPANPYFAEFGDVYKNYDILAQNRRNFDENFSFTPLFEADYGVGGGKRAAVVGVGQARTFAFATNATALRVQAALTRPHTQDSDAPLAASFDAKDGQVRVEIAGVAQKGRWQVELRADETGRNATKFYTIELWAK